MFFEAQLITQELKKGNDHLDKQGHVYLYPESTVGQENLTPYQTLTYIKYQSDDANESTFKKRLEANDPNIQNYFSVNPQGQLVIATLETTTVKTESKTDGDWFPHSSTQTTYKATEVSIDYKNMISQYTTSMCFFLDLGMTTRNPEFLEEVVNLVKANTNIQLTVLNTTTTKTTTQVDKETQHIRTREKVRIRGEEVMRETSTDKTTTTTTITTVKTVTPTVKVTSVDTWVCSQKITYSKIPGTLVEEEPYTIEQESESAKSLSSDTTREETVSWITREDSIINTSSISDTYDSGIASDYTDNTDAFIALLDVEHKLPNSKEKRTAGAYLKSDAELLFQLLSQNSETANMEIVMRYIMQKYDKYGDYEAEDFSFHMFDQGSFTTITGIYGSSVEDKFWYALKRMNYSNEAIAGAMGNIYCESGFKPTALNSSSGAYGLAQWLGGRRTNLQNYAASKGKTEEDEDCQIEFLIAELTGTGDAASYATRRTAGGKGANYHNYNDWADATDEREAAIAYCWFFETPSTASTKTDSILATEKKRADEATRYYELYKNRGAGGITETSNEKSVKCYYTASNGRKFTILDQTKISGWDGCCNRAACAIIASGYSNETPSQLINTRNTYGGEYYGVISGNNYWNRYGLQVTKIDKDLNIGNYQDELRNQLVSGGYAMIWLNHNNSTYYGKSGVKWTTLYHWVSIIDYKYENGVEKMAVADWRGITWVGLDEFTTHGIKHMIFVNEK